MPNFDASDIETQSVQCAVCEKEITGAKWFARVQHGPRMVALCCPLCTEVFERNPKQYIGRIETYGRMRPEAPPQSSFPLHEF